MAVNIPFKDSTVTTTNHTANYDLPLWNGEDATSWLTQMNDAMNKIDDGMVDAKSKALEVVGIAADAKKLADETKAESDESAKIVAGYNDRLTAVEEKSKEHTEDITNLNTRCDQFDVELHSVKEVQKKTTADLATLAEKVDSNKEEIDSKITEVDSKITEITTTIAKNKADADSKIATTNETVAQISAKEQALEKTVSSNTSTIVAINKNVEDLDSRMDSIESAQTSQGSNIAELTGEVDNLKSRVDGLTTRMNAIENTAQTTQTNLTTLSENTQNSFTEVDGKITDLTEKDTELQNAQSSQGSNITKLTGEVDNLKSRVDNLKSRVDGDDTAIAGLTARMSAVEKVAQTTQTNLTTLSENTQNSFTELDTRLSGDEEILSTVSPELIDVSNNEQYIAGSFIFDSASSTNCTMAQAAIRIVPKNGVLYCTLTNSEFVPTDGNKQCRATLKLDSSGVSAIKKLASKWKLDTDCILFFGRIGNFDSNTGYELVQSRGRQTSPIDGLTLALYTKTPSAAHFYSTYDPILFGFFGKEDLG